MSILILNSFRGKNIPYEAWLAESNKNLYLLCSDEQDLHQTSNHYQFVQSFPNYEENEDVVDVAAKIIKKHSIDTIIAKSECDLIRAAQLRDQFTIAGQSYEQALAFRDKVVMKTYLQKAGVPVPAFKRLNNREEALQFSLQHGFPLVLKPVDGAGSLNTYVINNREELLAIPKSQFAGMEIETFVEGKMYHIDGIVINGEIKFIYPSAYITSCLAYQNNQSMSGHVMDPTHPLFDRLITFVEQALAALPTPKNTTFHAEVFHTPEDKLIFCEIASRTGGGRIRESIISAFDINLDQLWIKTQAGINPDAQVWLSKPKVLSGWILIPPKKAKLIKFPDGNNLPDWVFEYRKTGQEGKSYNNPTKSSDCVASFVVIGDSEQHIKERLQEVETWFEANVAWQAID